MQPARSVCLLTILTSAFALAQSKPSSDIQWPHSIGNKASSSQRKGIRQVGPRNPRRSAATYYFNRGWARISGDGTMADTFTSPDGQSMNPRPDDFPLTDGIVDCVRSCSLSEVYSQSWNLVLFTPPGNMYQRGWGYITATTQNVAINGSQLTVSGSATGSAWFLPCEMQAGDCIDTGDTYILNAQFNYLAQFTGGADDWTLQDVYMASQNSVPLINQPLIPTATVPGGPGFVLNVNGTGFVSGSVVNWNGSPRPTAFVNSKELSATIGQTDIVAPTTAFVTVTSPGPGGGTSNTGQFNVIVPSNTVHMNRSDYGVGSNAFVVSTSDFNADGKLDLVVTNQSDNNVSILLGNGDGTFQPGVTFATATQPKWVAVEDLNGDGKPDLAVACFSPGVVSILFGNGDGTFQPHIDYSTGGGAFSIVTGDLNGDGKLDLAVANYDSQGTYAVLLGNGDGTFQPAVSYSTDSYPIALTMGDFNGDGTLDLAIVNQPIQGNSGVSIWSGNGDGTFQKSGSYTITEPFWVSTADFNGDGKLDLVVAAASLVILSGNGDGTFQSPVTIVSDAVDIAVVAGDFNGDGKLDLATVDEGSSAYILPGNGDGTFQSPVVFQTGSGPLTVTGADFNRDGRLDLATVNIYSSTVSVLLQGAAPITTTTVLSSSINPSRYGQSITLAATVVPAGSGTATGNVKFYDGATDLGASILNNGVAVLTTSTLTGGNHSLTASYAGNGIFAPSTSGVLEQAVAKASVGVSLSSSRNPSYVNDLVTFSAVVSGRAASPTGLLTFKKGTSVLATVPLTNGKANFTTAFTRAGSFSIVASYSGDQNYLPRNSKAVKQVVKKYATSTTVTSTRNPSAHGQPVTFTATVTSAGPPATGKVVFKNGSTSLGSRNLVNGVAALTTSKLPSGTLSITATYGGDTESEKNTSGVLVQIVN